jgi:hypothetical protein
MRLGVTVGLVLLSGCGMFGGADSRTGDGKLTDQAYCERRADDDPAVKELMIKGLGSTNFAASNQLQLRLAKQDAVTACLRSRGVIPPGGVERQKPI